MEYNLETIKKTSQNFYYNAVFTACSKQNIASGKLNDLIRDADDVTASATNTTVNIYTDNKLEKNDYLYMKPWNKMTLIHKTIKIKEFVNSLNINDENEKLKLKDLLIESIKDKIFNKKNKINYDSIKGNIISLSNLVFDNGVYHLL